MCATNINGCTYFIMVMMKDLDTTIYLIQLILYLAADFAYAKIFNFQISIEYISCIRSQNRQCLESLYLFIKVFIIRIYCLRCKNQILNYGKSLQLGSNISSISYYQLLYTTTIDISSVKVSFQSILLYCISLQWLYFITLLLELNLSVYD